MPIKTNRGLVSYCCCSLGQFVVCLSWLCLLVCVRGHARTQCHTHYWSGVWLSVCCDTALTELWCAMLIIHGFCSLFISSHFRNSFLLMDIMLICEESTETYHFGVGGVQATLSVWPTFKLDLRLQGRCASVLFGGFSWHSCIINTLCCN